MSVSASQIEQAILALHNSQNPHQQEQANLFLLSFNESEAAWGISLELLTRSPALLVQFYAANCLYSKIVRDWLQIQDESSIGSVSATLLEFLKGCPDVQQLGDQRTVAARVCLALAALSVKLSDGIPQLVQEVFSSFLGGSSEALAAASPGAVILGLLIVRSLPEEVEKVDMSRLRRDELQGKLREVAPTIMQVVEFLTNHRPDVAADALHALNGWLGIGAITLVSLARDAPSLFEALRRIVANPSSVPVEVVIRACEVLTRLVGISQYPRPSSRDAVATKVMEAILAGLPIAMRVLEGPDDEQPMHAYCTLVVEVAKSEVELISKPEQAGPGLGMVEMLLALTGHSNLHVSTLTMEFWEALRDVPMAQRAACLGPPLSLRILGVLLDRLSYPSSFTSWDKENAVDEEDFTRFREGDLTKELLVSCYLALRTHYFMQLGQRLDEAGRDTWQVAEVVLLMMQQVSGKVLQYLEHHLCHVGSTPANATAAEDQASTARFLLQMLHRFIEAPTTYAEQPLVLRALSRLLGSGYCQLLSPRGNRNPQLQGLLTDDQSRAMHRLALRCLLQALTTEEAGEAASMALKVLCVSPTGLSVVKADRECLELLMASFERAGHLDITHQLSVVEAIVRVVVETDQARAGLNHFTSPILNGLNNALVEAPDSRQRETVKVALQLLGQTVRFLDGKGHNGNHGNHVAQDLVGCLWPMLGQAAVLYQSDSEVLDHLFVVYKHLLVGLRPLVAPRLQQLLVTISELYAATHHEGALDVVGTVTEIFTPDRLEGTGLQDATDHQAFSGLLATMCRHTWDYISNGHPPAECPGLVSSFFDMIMRFLSFRSTVLYQCPELSTVLDFALECLEAMERESTRSVLRWIREVFRHCEQNPQEPTLVVPVQLLQERGQRLVSVTMAALAGRAPSTLWANYFELFYGMIVAWATLASAAGQPSPCGVWVRQAAFDAAVIGDTLPAESRELLVSLIQKQAVEGKQKLKLFMDDVAKICKSEQEPHALTSYQVT